MSAFLGPIHYWLYNKIQLQERLNEAILESLGEPLTSEYAKLADTTCGSVERAPLEEVIDTGNIHGWLQGQIGIAERRFAFIVGRTQFENVCSLDELKQVAFEAGRAAGVIAEPVSPSAAFKVLTDSLLDGMPCDRVNQVIEQDDVRTVWQQTQDIHAHFWNEFDADPRWYWTLREQFTAGLLAQSGCKLSREDTTYTLSKVG